MRGRVRSAGWVLLALAVVVVAVIVTVGALQARGDAGFNRWVGWATVAALPIAAAGLVLVVWDRPTLRRACDGGIESLVWLQRSREQPVEASGWQHRISRATRGPHHGQAQSGDQATNPTACNRHVVLIVSTGIDQVRAVAQHVDRNDMRDRFHNLANNEPQTKRDRLAQSSKRH